MSCLINVSYHCSYCGDFSSNALVTEFDKEEFSEKMELCVLDKNLKINNIYLTEDEPETIVDGIQYESVAKITRFNTCIECKRN